MLTSVTTLFGQPCKETPGKAFHTKLGNYIHRLVVEFRSSYMLIRWYLTINNAFNLTDSDQLVCY